MGNVDVNKVINMLKNPKDRSAEFTPEDAEKNKVVSLLSYIWILWLVPFLAAKDSKLAKFHANQGLLLFIIETALGIVNAILGGIPVLGVIIGIICGVAGIVCLVYAILGIVNAVQGKAKEIPFIGNITLIK